MASPSYVTLLGVVTFVSRPVAGAVLLGAYACTRATAAAILAQSLRRTPMRAISWGYALAPLWRLAAILLTCLTTGVLVAASITRHAF